MEAAHSAVGAEILQQGFSRESAKKRAVWSHDHHNPSWRHQLQALAVRTYSSSRVSVKETGFLTDRQYKGIISGASTPASGCRVPMCAAIAMDLSAGLIALCARCGRTAVLLFSPLVMMVVGPFAVRERSLTRLPPCFHCRPCHGPMDVHKLPSTRDMARRAHDWYVTLCDTSAQTLCLWRTR